MSKKVKQLLKENALLERDLNEENNNVLTDIVCYIRSFPISLENQERVRKDIVLMLLNGQNNNLNSTEVIGDNYQEFCDTLIKELPLLTYKQRIIIAFGNLCLYVAIMSVILLVTSLIKDLLVSNRLNVNIQTSFLSIIQLGFIIFLSFGIVEYICKNSFNSFSKRKKMFIVLGVLAVFLITVVFLLVMKDIVLKINLFIWLGFTLLLLIIHQVIDNLYQ